VKVIEAESAIVPSPRAMVYHWSVLEGIEKLGLLDEAIAAGFTKQDYTYSVFATGERISLSVGVLDGLVRHPYNLHLGQHRLAEIALAHLNKIIDTPVDFGTTVLAVTDTGEEVHVEADSQGGPRQYTAKWVIGADGARSTVRKCLGLEFEGFTWPERFVATNVYYDFERYDYGRSTLQIDPSHGAIIAKIDNDDLWRVTYCEPLDLPEATIIERMPAFFDAILPGPKDFDLDQYSPYRMHQRSASRLRAGRVVLAGDAAHSTNPTGALGLTSGLFDTFVLYDALAAVITGRADDSVLDRYAAERKRIFDDIVTPRASENKRLVYHSSDPARLQQDLDGLRRLASDPQMQIERFLFNQTLQTPALV
jgi:3-(3-hydroxy-phenyl)propionate hydroxylase